MSQPDAIEFFCADRLVTRAESSHAPDRGDGINIRGQNYRVIGRTYTVDYADDPNLRSVTCVLTMEKLP